MKANVLVKRNGRALLCDFGIARVLGVERTGMTTSGEWKGTYPWCSPEILNGDRLEPPSDVWAWAMLAWEVSGFVPLTVVC